VSLKRPKQPAITLYGGITTAQLLRYADAKKGCC
jgi:hypothetical protein